MIWNLNLIALVLSVVIASFSQMLLKNSSGKERRSVLFDYLNIEVIIAYIMLLASTLLVIFALQKIEYKNVSIINSFGQVLVLILGWKLLGEKLSIFKVAGIILIIIGTVIYFA